MGPGRPFGRRRRNSNMGLDSAIVAVFGEPPDTIDLSETTTGYDNGVVVALSIMAVLAVAGRLWARRIKAAPIWIDDILIFIALVLELVTMALSIVGGKYGSGHHVWDLEMSDLKMIFKLLYGYTFIYGAAAAAIKLSFIFCYVRVFHTGSPLTVFKCSTYISIAILIGGFLGCAYPLMVWTTMLGLCRPIHYFWDEYTEPTGGSCVDSTLFFLVAGVINMIIDIAILLIPIPCIVKLQIKRPEKLMLVCIFLLGEFVCVASAVRIYYLQVLRSTVDVTYSMGSVFIWSSVEPAVGILSSCLIALRPVFMKLWSMILGTDLTTSRKGTSQFSRQDNVYDGPSDLRSSDDELALVKVNTNIDPRHIANDAGIQVTREVNIHDSTGQGKVTRSKY